MATSTPVHASSALASGSTAILGGLPRISGRGGDEALEGPKSVEVVLLSALGSGAALSVEGATLALAGAAGVDEGASGVLVVLAVMGAADAAPVVFGVPPALGGSVMQGAVAAPAVDGASADARSSSSLAAPVWQWTPGQGPAWSSWSSSSSSSSSLPSSPWRPWGGGGERKLGKR
jgi:hypothetical protein